MRVLIFVLVLVAFLCVCECKKHKKRDVLERGKKIGVSAPSANPYHRGVKYHRGGRMRGQHLFLDKKGKHTKRGRWMSIPKRKAECKTTKCEDPKDFCIVHPTHNIEKCISKHDFKEGRRLFRQFHKQKKHMKDESQVQQLERDLIKGEKMKDVFDLMNHHAQARFNGANQKYGRRKHIQDMDKKQVQAVEQKQDTMFKEAMNEHECRATEISELKKRLIGWFDMIHTMSRQEHHRQHHHDMKHHDMKHHDMKHLNQEPKWNKMKADDMMRAYHRKGSKQHHKRNKRAIHDTVEKESHGSCMCSKSAMWDLRKQDINADGHLTENEMVAMESNRREPCMKPLLQSCDTDHDGKLTRGEWCCCFQKKVTPCFDKKKLSNAEDWVPNCDSEGYFQREQCHKSGNCWCTDINGNLIEDTKTKGKADCGKYGPNGYLIKH